MSGPLTGKIAVVTGGSRGIGRATSRALSRDGALVVVHYGKNAAAAAETVKAIEADGGKAFAVGGDLAAHNAAETLFAALDPELKARTGQAKFDILVNNAGIAPFVAFADTTEAVLDEIYAVNVKAPFLISKLAGLRLNDGGRIVNVSSVVSRLPFPAVAAYSVLKAPVDVLTQVLAAEYGARNITVNAVAPGVIATDLAEFVQSDEGQAFTLGMQALKRIGKPEDVADVIALLAGPQTRWVTGQTIEVSGGTSITL